MRISDDRYSRDRQRFDLALHLEHDIAGHDSLKHYGATVRPDLLEKVRAADGLMLGPMATYDFKDESKGEINPSKFFRKSLDLYANIRPARTYPGLPGRLGDFDLVVVRENTEGFYADRSMHVGPGEFMPTPDCALSFRKVVQKRKLANQRHGAANSGALRLDGVLKRHAHPDNLQHRVERGFQNPLAIRDASLNCRTRAAARNGKVCRFPAMGDHEPDVDFRHG